MNIIRRLLEWATSPHQARVIYDRDGKSPYLSRYYLFGGPKMPDGSNPFTDLGHMKPETLPSTAPVSVMVHKFHRGDAAHELHNHPWAWAVSMVLAGGYIEERRIPPGSWRGDIEVREVRPWRLNIITSGTFHRVDLIERDAWSLFVTGPKFSGWGFWDRRTGEFTPWREFVRKMSTKEATP